MNKFLLFLNLFYVCYGEGTTSNSEQNTHDEKQICAEFEFRGKKYVAGECRYDYFQKKSWCATSVKNNEIITWKYCPDDAKTDRQYNKGMKHFTYKPVSAMKNSV